MSTNDDDHNAMSWLSDDMPHDPQRSEAQVAGLLQLLSGSSKRVLDLGCGVGRVLLPLMRAGHTVVGMDIALSSLDACKAQLGDSAESIRLLRHDFLTPWPDLNRPFDVVCCLGNTFMTVHDVRDAVMLLRQVSEALTPGGLFMIDDCPHDFWPEVTEGNWQSGLSEDGEMQMIWEPGDAVFAIRTGAAVDPETWHLTEADQRLRLWSLGALRLVVEIAGLSAPEHEAASCVLIMRRPAESAG